MHEGHRQRMLQRLEDAEHLQDHELLEILLFNAIPRKNTNPLAHELLAEFVSLDGLMRASYEELLNVQGIGKETAAYLRCIAILCERLKKREDPLPRLFNVRDFSGFLFERLAPLKEEVIELFALDAQQHIIAEKHFTVCATDRAALEPEAVNQFLAVRKPAGLVVAHNHPAAPAHPSAADDKFTAQMQVVCSMNNVRFYDHIIVGTDGTYSYFLVGRMEEIRRAFDLNAIVGGKILRD